MGNWTKVQIVGTCDAHEVHRLRGLIGVPYDDPGWSCLSFNGGLAGLPNWGGVKIDAVGNLAERGYSEESIAEHARKLAFACPSLELKIHVGGDYESSDVISTVTVSKDEATVGEAEIDSLPNAPPGQAQANMMAQMTGQLT